MFRWLNSKVLRFIDRRRDAAVMVRVRVQGEDLVFDDRHGDSHCVAIGDIRRVVAVRCEAYAGDETTLLIEISGDAVIPVGSSCGGWQEMSEALERRLPGALPLERWHTCLLTAAVGEPIVVWPAPPAATHQAPARLVP